MIENDIIIAQKFYGLKDINQEELEQYLITKNKILKSKNEVNMSFITFAIIAMIFIILKDNFSFSKLVLILILFVIFEIYNINKDKNTLNLLNKSKIKIANCYSYEKSYSSKSGYYIKVTDKNGNFLKNKFKISQDAYKNCNEIVAKMYIRTLENKTTIDVIALYDLEHENKKIRILSKM